MNPQATPSLSRRRLLVITGALALVLGLVVLALHAWAGWRAARGPGIVLLIMGAIWLIASRFACSEPLRPNQRRYLREFFPAMLAYLLMVFTFKWLLAMVQAPVLRGLIALLPVIPMVFVVRTMVRKLLDGDELERRMQLEAVSIASITVGLVSFTFAFLEVAGVFHVEQALMLVLPGLFLAYGLALFFVRRRYQGP